MADNVPHRFSTGAERSSDRDEERWDLISPIALRTLARTYAEGAVKRGDFNWENGMPVTDLLNHGIAHIYAFLSGDRSEEHLGHAAWNILGAIHSLEKWPELNEGWLRGEGCTCPPAAVVAKKEPPLETSQITVKDAPRLGDAPGWSHWMQR